MNSLKKSVKYILSWISSIIHRNHKSKILYYHDIFSNHSYKSLDSDVLMGTSLEMFKQHLDVVRKEGYVIVPHITKPEGEVAIMLDDGFRGIWDNRQFFRDNNICPTVFLAVDLIGKEGFLTEKEILELQNKGFIFECHSWSHTDLTQKSDNELKKELFESKNYLSNLLSKTITEICLPLGYFSDSLLCRLKEYGYSEVYSSIPGKYDDKVNGYMRRRNLCQFATPNEVKYILRGGNSVLERRLLSLHHRN